MIRGNDKTIINWYELFLLQKSYGYKNNSSYLITGQFLQGLSSHTYTHKTLRLLQSFVYKHVASYLISNKRRLVKMYMHEIVCCKVMKLFVKITDFIEDGFCYVVFKLKATNDIKTMNLCKYVSAYINLANIFFFLS